MGHASAQQLKRVLVDSDRLNMQLLSCVDKVVGQCEICRAFDGPPNLPIDGTAPVSSFRLFWATRFALHAMDLYSKEPTEASGARGMSPAVRGL